MTSSNVSAGAPSPTRKAYENPAMSAPSTGARMKSQSCSIAAEPAKRAGPMERAGFTDVFVTGIDTRWMRVSASPIASGANPFGARVSTTPRMT